MITRILDGMTKRIGPVPLTGGPMHGQTYRPGTRWPHYLGPDGQPITSTAGDRVMARRSRTLPGCYVIQRPMNGPVSYAWRPTHGD
jgi:hypothetical protein